MPEDAVANDCFTSPESILGKISSCQVFTLATLDIPIQATSDQIWAMGLEPNGWRDDISEEGLLAHYKRVFGESLVEKIESGRPGGTTFSTMRELSRRRDGTIDINCHVPVGLSGADTSILANSVNTVFNGQLGCLDNGLNVYPHEHENTMSPLVVSFTSTDEEGRQHRSMVLIPGCKSLGIAEVQPAQNDNGKTIVALDAYELIDPEKLTIYGQNAERALLASEENFLLLGLGGTDAVENGYQNIARLLDISGESAISGNEEEIPLLLEKYGCADTSELIQRFPSLRFVLETHGKDGATLYYRHQNEVSAVSYVLPEEEKFVGDTTNAGDIFLGVMLSELMDLVPDPENIEEQLASVLHTASLETLARLQEKGRNS